jgi:DNA-binding transcriptional MerR regulator
MPLEKGPEAFRTISEVADEIDVPQHVLRFWESRFSQIRPMKRGGGRRFYRPEDVDLLRGVRHLLYGEGYTIRGVQRILREEGTAFVQNVWRAGAEQPRPQAAEDKDEEESSDAALARRTEPDLSSFTLPPQRRGDSSGERPAERHEPEAAARPSVRSRDAQARRKLAAALDDLIECRRIIETALMGQDTAGPAGEA